MDDAPIVAPTTTTKPKFVVQIRTPKPNRLAAFKPDSTLDFAKLRSATWAEISKAKKEENWNVFGDDPTPQRFNWATRDPVRKPRR
jgi:hypothetical protein